MARLRRASCRQKISVICAPCPQLEGLSPSKLKASRDRKAGRLRYEQSNLPFESYWLRTKKGHPDWDVLLFGSGSKIRTYDQVVNSHLLYR